MSAQFLLVLSDPLYPICFGRIRVVKQSCSWLYGSGTMALLALRQHTIHMSGVRGRICTRLPSQLP